MTHENIIHVMALIGTGYLITDIYKLAASVSRQAALGKKLTTMWYNTIIYREYEYNRFKRVKSKEWESYDWQQLYNLDRMLSYNERFRRNRHTPEYVARVAKLRDAMEIRLNEQLSLEREKNIKEWQP